MGIRVLGCDFSLICGTVENPKFEARNPKQFQKVQIQMTETLSPWVSVLNIGAFVF
jgi:hypothetical protein